MLLAQQLVGQRIQPSAEAGAVSGGGGGLVVFAVVRGGGVVAGRAGLLRARPLNFDMAVDATRAGGRRNEQETVRRALEALRRIKRGISSGCWRRRSAGRLTTRY